MIHDALARFADFGLLAAAWLAAIAAAVFVLREALALVLHWRDTEAAATVAWWRRWLNMPTWCQGCGGTFAFRWFRWVDDDKLRCRDCVADCLRGER